MKMFPGAALAAAALLCAASVVAQQPATPAGHYEGVIQSPNGEVKFSVDLDRDAAQAWIGSLSMLPGGPRDLPLEKISVSGDNVSFAIAAKDAPSFTGKWDRAEGVIAGNVTSPKGEVPFELKRTGDPKVAKDAPSTPLAPEFAGVWEGTLSAGGRSLRLQVKLEQGPDGKARGTLASLDQGGQAVPIGSITQSGANLEFTVRLLNGTFKGKMDEAKTAIAGDWTQGPRTLPLTLKKAAQ